MMAAMSVKLRRLSERMSRNPCSLRRIPSKLGGCGVKCVTLCGVSVTLSDMASNQKRRALNAHGTLNPEPKKVTAEQFRHHREFFDADDRLQVRYEMLRGPAVGELTVTDACAAFGVSRQTFYTLRRAFDAQGIAGLFEGKRGRKGPLKASGEVVEFVRAAKTAEPSLSGAHIARLVDQKFGVVLHRRTVERLLEPKSGARLVVAKGA
jgi:transposase